MNNNGNVQSTSAKTKNNNLVFIIVGVVVAAFFAFLYFGTGVFSNKSVNKSNLNGNGKILQVLVTDDYVIMLDRKNDLYIYGDYGYYIGSNDGTKPVGKDVKSFDRHGNFTMIDKKNNSYSMGLDINGWGVNKEFKLLKENVKEISANNFCHFIIDDKNNYVVRGPLENKNGMKFCALPEGFDGNFSIVSKDVKAIYNAGSTEGNGYLTSNNELYVSSIFGKHEYVKVLSDVKEIYNKELILTNDNKLYTINFHKGDTPVAEEKASDVDTVYNVVEKYFVYKGKDGKFYSTFSNKTELKYDDMKIPYFYSLTKVVYLNNKNKLVLAGEKDKKELELSLASMKEIHDFLK